MDSTLFLSLNVCGMRLFSPLADPAALGILARCVSFLERRRDGRNGIRQESVRMLERIEHETRARQQHSQLVAC